MSVESPGENVVESEHYFAQGLCAESFNDMEIIIVIQYVRVVNHVFVREVVAGKGHHLVEYRAGIPQPAVGLLRDHMHGFGLEGHALALRHKSKMIADVL